MSHIENKMARLTGRRSRLRGDAGGRDDDVPFEDDEVALSMGRVYALVASGMAEPDDESLAAEVPGWRRAAEVVRATLGTAAGGDDADDVQVSFAQLASQCRRAFARAAVADGDADIPPFADLPPAARFAWEGAVRHAANLLGGMGKEEAQRVADHERRMARFMLNRLDPAAAVPLPDLGRPPAEEEVVPSWDLGPARPRPQARPPAPPRPTVAAPPARALTLTSFDIT